MLDLNTKALKFYEALKVIFMKLFTYFDSDVN